MHASSNKPNALQRVLRILVAAFAWSFTRKQSSPTRETPRSTPPHANDLEFCRHPSHGVSPGRRKFLTRGISESGRPFNVFQCRCGEFVAIATQRSTGEKYILFRGCDFAPRRDRRINSARTVANVPDRTLRSTAGLKFARTLLLPVIFGLALMAAGCSPKSYLVQLDDQEAIAPGADVSLDGKPIGQVTEITRQGETRVARFLITAPSTKIKAGVQRQERGRMNFSSATVAENAPTLESGAILPTRAPVVNFAKTTVQSARDFFYRTYALHPVLTVAGVVLAASLVCLLFGLCRRALVVLIAILIGLALFLCAGSTGHAQSVATPVGQRGVLFTRDFLRQEQSQVRRHISEAERSSDTAARLLDGRLVRDGGEELVRGLFRLDSADLLLEGQPDRIAQLKSAPFSYVRADEQTKLAGNYAALRQQLQNAQERMAMLRLRCTSTNEQDTMLLQVFLAKRESFRIRARAGDTDATAVLEECRRLASVNKSEADLARCKRRPKSVAGSRM